MSEPLDPTTQELVDQQMERSALRAESTAHQPPPLLIYRRLSMVAAEIGAIGKTGQAAAAMGGYSFRSIDDVLKYTHAALIKHNVLAIPAYTELDVTPGKTSKNKANVTVRVRLELRFIAADGSSLTVSVYGEGMDTGDKATAKAMAVAFKYAITLGLCLPVEGLPETENGTDERGEWVQETDPADSRLMGWEEGPQERTGLPPAGTEDNPEGLARAARLSLMNAASVLGISPDWLETYVTNKVNESRGTNVDPSGITAGQWKAASANLEKIAAHYREISE